MKKPFLLIVGYNHDLDSDMTDGWIGFYSTEEEAEDQICVHNEDKTKNARYSVKGSDMEPYNYYEWYDIIDVRKHGAE
jgi:hypothetical protein